MIQRLNTHTLSLTLFEDSSRFMERVIGLQSQPDIFLLDIHVQPHNGFEMLTLLRSHPAYRASPVVALTASVMNEEVEQLKHAGFEGVLGKPIDIDTFPSSLRRIMNGEHLWFVW